MKKIIILIFFIDFVFALIDGEVGFRSVSKDCNCNMITLNRFNYISFYTKHDSY